MTQPANEVSRRLDRLLRMERAGNVLLIVGWALVFLGLGAVILTISLTTEQWVSFLRNSKKFAHGILLWLPAPGHLRVLGVVTMFVGFLAVALASVLRKDKQHQ